jgi:hypothetical protein
VWLVGSQVSTVQGSPSSHWSSAVQQPAIGVKPHVPSVHVAALQVAPGQSLSSQHCRHVPPQFRVPLGQAQVPFRQTWPPSSHVSPSCAGSAAVTHVPPLQVVVWQTGAAGQVPQVRSPPQPSEIAPHVAPCASQVVGVQPQTLSVPPPPQLWGAEHVPQFSVPPQPSEISPQFRPRAAQVVGVQQAPAGYWTWPAAQQTLPLPAVDWE